MCNKEIKFKLLYAWAMKQGFDFLATGHYAQSKGGQLLQSSDAFKDQTYFIYNLQPAQLPHVLFPVGGMKKSAVRALAKKLKLPNADKKESMGLCFVGRIRLKDFLEQKLKPKRGPIKNEQGVRLGMHEGLYYYTIGQRQGIRVGNDGPYYVYKKELKTNTLFVTNDPKDPLLETKELELHSVNWITKPKTFSAKLHGRFRHQGPLVPLTIHEAGKGHYRVTFVKPQKAVASGQSLVLYNKQVCMGGGVIV
jgi:tRNA-specific 2-thiouridylase